MEINVRQQTSSPGRMTKLLFVGVAPPYQNSPVIRTIAKSATTDSGDNLRQLIEAAVALPWDDLVAKGVFLIHAVKCAIVPDEAGFQNPSSDIIDRCCSVGFADELQLLHPTRIVAFGGAARRAVLKHPSITVPRGVGVSKTLKKLQESWPGGIPGKFGDTELMLYPAPFPRSAAAKSEAAGIIKEAVRFADLLKAAG